MFIMGHFSNTVQWCGIHSKNCFVGRALILFVTMHCRYQTWQLFIHRCHICVREYNGQKLRAAQFPERLIITARVESDR